ncbi:MAG: sodium:proline symporter [Nitrospiraceae bacterium]|nr:sodium:proline symporter [Nitrospiraceae bacterium]
MGLLDWVIVAGYVCVALGIGAVFARKAGKSKEDYFLAGRSLGWLVAGTSIVATTFSADTPVFVAGMTRDTGIHYNWFWWSALIGQIATVFFFARLWRRSGVLTDIEFIVARYQPSPANAPLRIFKVFFDGIYYNCVVMASVTLAMAKILKVVLDLSDEAMFTIPLFGDVTSTGLLLCVLGLAAVVYSAMSGLYGVVYTDLVQFALAMAGSITLAVIVYVDISKGDGLHANLASSSGFEEGLLNFLPDLSTFDMATFTFIVFITVSWWGAAPGKGYTVQRLLSTRSERDSFFAFLWYNVCHYLIRPWPWIIVGICSLYYFPDLADSETAFPAMINRFLPVGLKGIIVASLLAAFMSTLDTHLNWGVSYLINDLYEPYIRPGLKPHHYVRVSRISMLLLTILTLFATTKLTSILDAYKYLGVISGGIGTVMIARWYWWRVNAWSEITALALSLVVGNGLTIFLKNTEEVDYFSVRLVITIGVTLVGWVAVTYLTSRKPTPQTETFYRKMRIGGPGWALLRKTTGVEPRTRDLGRMTAGWLLCSTLMIALLMGAGKFLLHEWTAGLICLAVAVASGIGLKVAMKNVSFAE